MKLPTALVAVKKINSNVARSSFPAEDIERGAHLIVGVEGIINPIILRRTSLESYEIVDGHFEYYAAVRAREISPLKGEMIQAIILEVENEKMLLEQVDLFRKEVAPELDDSNLELRFANLEKIFQSQFEELRKDNRNLERSIAEITSKVQNSSFGEEVINTITERILEAVQQARKKTKKTVDELRKTPIDLNLASKAELMAVPYIGEKTALKIIEEKQKRGKFSSIEELLETDKRIKSLFDKNQLRECFTIHEPET